VAPVQANPGSPSTSAADFLRNYINPVGAKDALIQQRLSEVDKAEKSVGVTYQPPSTLPIGGTPAQIERTARALGWSGQ
jgi:hypothetical protein